MQEASGKELFAPPTKSTNVSSCTPASAEPWPTVKPGGFPGIGSCADTALSSSAQAATAVVRSIVIIVNFFALVVLLAILVFKCSLISFEGIFTGKSDDAI